VTLPVIASTRQPSRAVAHGFRVKASVGTYALTGSADVMPPRTRLGSWCTLSGNGCVVDLVGTGPIRVLEVRWDQFPLTATDKTYYMSSLLPKITRRAQEYLELSGPAFVVPL
jgi:hypothetical protein